MRKTLVLLGLAAGLAGAALRGQVWENPKDPMGILIPYPFVHLVHAHAPPLKGTAADLRATDPFLFYQLGRDLLHREFKLGHGIYGQAGVLSVPLYATTPDRMEMVHGVPARFARDHSASCGMCHSSLFREPSAGQTIGSTGGMGRNTPHFFGAGLVEMIGAEVEALVLEQYDRNRDGLISRDEVAKPCPVRIRPSPEAEPIDFGDLAPGPDGVPRLNPAFRVWYVDAGGKILKDALSLKDPRAAAFGFAFQPFGWGRGWRMVKGVRVAQGGETSSVREFYTVAADFHMGLQAHDPTQQGSDPAASGFGGRAQVSLNGAQQYDFGGSVDPGHRLSRSGLSLDDPDHDGFINELTEGDVDAVEFYLLHAPPPATRATATSEGGREVLLRVGCAHCHVESWQLAARDERRGLAGDRRLFRLETRSRPGEDGLPELVGKLVRSERVLPTGEHVPAYDGFKVERIYSDFKQWDIGPEFYERRFDGSLQKEHRTAPLWGVGSTAPYGHDGHFMTLDEAIGAHGGAAEHEARAYRDLTAAERASLLAYLRSLVLYQTDVIPTDIDGDGKIADDFSVAGQPVGYERFDARFLFAHPPHYGNVGDYTRYDRREMPLLMIQNIAEAYGLDLPARRDTQGDGFPDVIRAGADERAATHAQVPP
ncbi:MAG TPA: di-heme oxidoredictase family protein [Thermoanaerobaculia bacterium]|nr:di-heme oxidoredictase family protein [Thermoanaerobaculia bacterium]